jgi:lipopolysaccharide export system permease protein
VQFFLDFTLVMLGLPVMLSRRNRNAYVSIGLCLGVATALTVASLGCQSLGALSLLPPTLAAWLPLLGFVPLAAGLSLSLRT